MGEWPIYKKELLVLGNPKSSVGLCTLWTEKEKVLEHVSPENYLIAGQCYSKSEGISLIVRHALANKGLGHIVLCGADLDHTGDALVALDLFGVDKDRKIIEVEGAELEQGIPLEAIERFRQHVDIIDRRDVKDFSCLDGELGSLPHKPSWGEPEVYDRPIPDRPESYPSEATGFVVRGRTVGETWLRVLDSILRFGYVKKSQYSDDQQEIVNLTAVVSEEDPKNIAWKPYFQFTKGHLEDYLPQLMTSEVPGDVSYTYGSRLRDFHGKVDQIDSMVEQLKKAIYSRRAVGVTWDVEKDHNNSHSPCLDLIQALVQDKLHTTAYIRSNDMFGGWPENALGLRTIQAEISDRVGVEMGDLIIISNSAHIYEGNWQQARDLVKKYPAWRGRDPDPRGSVLVDLEGGRIKVSHLSPEGRRIGEFYAENAIDAYRKMVDRQIISQVGHALDIGVELGKADYALRAGLEYVQDRPLDVK